MMRKLIVRLLGPYNMISFQFMANWQVQHLGVQVHEVGQDGPRELKLGV